MVIALKNQKQIILRLDQGEELIEVLKVFVKNNAIKAGWIFGLGSSREAELAYYDLDKKRYLAVSLGERLEVLSLLGNISWQRGKPVIHIHGVLGNRDLRTFSGHVKRLVVSATLELRIDILDGELKRERNETIGLDLLA